MFNKKEYWARRNNTFHVTDESGEIIATVKKPLRGQTDKVEPKTISKVEAVNINNVEYGFNRKSRRKRVINRLFTKKGYTRGVRKNAD